MNRRGKWTAKRPLTPSTVERAPHFSGVYEISLADGTYEYPGGWSSVVYYGSSSTLRDRLEDHVAGRTRSELARLMEEEPLLVRWRRSDDPRRDEEELVLDFTEEYGALPCANHRIAWQRLY